MLKTTLVALSLCFGLGLTTTTFAAPTPVSANQTITGKKVSTTQAIVAYFDSVDNEYSATPDAEGFYRVLLGRDEQGNFLVQDFFQKSGKIQTDPYWLFDAQGLTSFSVDYVDGLIKGYYSNGNVAFQGTLKEGQYQTSFDTFYPTGGIAHRTTPLNKDHSRVEYFYQNGKKAALFEYDEEGETTKEQAWDEKGKASKNSEEITNAILDLINMSQ